jgi:hypothetical protein
VKEWRSGWSSASAAVIQASCSHHASTLGDTGRVRRVVCPSLVGRDGEWSELVRCLDGAAAGHGGLVAVVGEVGVGKTRLTGDLSDVARARGMSVLLGRAVDTGAPVPFRALFEALSGYFRRAGAEAHPGLGRAATSAGRWEQAAAHVDWALRIALTTPDSPSALIDLAAAEIAVGQGRFGDARTRAQSPTNVRTSVQPF